MTPAQKKNALEGLQERIDRVAKKYQKEVLWNHKEYKYELLGIKAKEFKNLIEK